MGSLWNRSGMVERYADDLRATGAQAFFYNGGTTTPLVVFRDSAESSAHTFPVIADANGRWPDVFIPYITSYDVQVKTADGVQITFTQQVPNPDPVDLSVTIDPTNTVQTGMIHAEMVNTTKNGYVRLNGRTLGNAASTATERANADTQNLFVYLWNNLSNAIAPVSGGRGASGASDFSSNKTITLPNLQGALLIGLDDMGSTAGNFFSGLAFSSGSSVIAGSLIGANGLALTGANLPAHSHTGTTSNESVSGTTASEGQAHYHGFSGFTDNVGSHNHGGFTGSITTSLDHTHSYDHASGTFVAGNQGPVASDAMRGPATIQTGTSSIGGMDHSHYIGTDGTHYHGFSGNTDNEAVAHNHTFTSNVHAHSFSTSVIGASAPFNNLARSVLVTWYIKL